MGLVERPDLELEDRSRFPSLADSSTSVPAKHKTMPAMPESMPGKKKKDEAQKLKLTERPDLPDLDDLDDKDDSSAPSAVGVASAPASAPEKS